MIELRHLRHLLAVAEHPTLQAAAEALYLTQPALTKSIARFEEELGASLFDRSGRRLILTELGQRLVERGEALLRQTRHLEEEVEIWKQTGLGEINLGAGPNAELSRVPRVLAQFFVDWPGVRVVIRSGHTGTLLPALLAGELHLAVCEIEPDAGDGDLLVEPLTAEPIAALVRADHPLLRKRVPTFADTAAYPTAGASAAPRFQRWLAAALPSQDSSRGANLTCDNYEVLARTAETTDFVVLGPRGVLEESTRSGRLALLPLEFDGPTTKPSVIRCRGRTLPPAAEHLALLFSGA